MTPARLAEIDPAVRQLLAMRLRGHTLAIHPDRDVREIVDAVVERFGCVTDLADVEPEDIAEAVLEARHARAVTLPRQVLAVHVDGPECAPVLLVYTRRGVVTLTPDDCDGVYQALHDLRDGWAYVAEEGA